MHSPPRSSVPGRMPRVARQHGGTLTGVIIGLIIGLVIAVWVAMTIMKTPLPFVDRLGKQSQPAGELGDPNKTLPGGARERRERLDDVPTEETPSAGKKSRETPAADTDLGSESPAADKGKSDKGKNDKATSDKSTSDKSASDKSSGDKSAADAPASDERFTYYLQAGAFREQSDAEATKARLALMGVAATIADRKTDVGTLYRVRVGPFPDVETMNRTRLRLSDNGVDVAVVRVPK